MLLRRYISTASVICSLTLGLAAPAFADDVTIGTTGANSTQKVEIDNSSNVTTSNTNNVDVVNLNVQKATTGNVNADKNTSVGGDVTSGNASNANTTATTVAVTNESASGLPGGGSGNGSGGSGNGSGGSGNGAGGSGGGSVQGASTTGGMGSGEPAVLPEVGASVPVDVSALRAAWHPQNPAATAALAKSSGWLTGAMLLTATLLSLLGAIGSAVYAKRREEVV